MEPKKEDHSIEAEATIKMEDTEEEHFPQVGMSPPTLNEMVENPKAFRRYVAALYDATPQAPPDLYGEAFRNWRYRHLLTATLEHLLAVFKDHDDPKHAAWQYYEAYLKVNNTDYPESHFMAQTSASALFRHEAAGRHKCARVAAGLPERKVYGKRKKAVKVEEGGGKRRRMLD